MPLDLAPKRTLSDRAQSQRVITRLLSTVAGLFLALTFAAAKDILPQALMSSMLGLMLAAMIGAAWSGWRTRQLAIEDREKQSSGAMIIAIAAQLGRQDDATLEQIRAKGGPAAEAARMILTERKARADRTRG